MRFFLRIQSTALLLTSLLGASVAAFADPQLNGRLLASQCFQCHNGKGLKTGFDGIVGESASEIYKELIEMRAEAATEPEIMHSQALIYTSEEVLALATYLSTLPKGR